MDVVQQKDPRIQGGDEPVQVSAIGQGPHCREGSLQTLQHPQLVPLCLQLPDEPGAGVGEGFVVQVNGVLSG